MDEAVPELRPRHKSVRLPDFDYSSASTYFFTICTAGRAPFLGEVERGQIYMTRTGVQAWTEWDTTLALRPTVIEHAFVAMPNHVHGLISFDERNAENLPVESHSNATRLLRRSRSLSTLVSGYKGAVTRWVRRELRDPKYELWQPGYHEHIVRNHRSFEQIEGYILHNVARWSEDRENPANWDRI
jgi:putative transposase